MTLLNVLKDHSKFVVFVARNRRVNPFPELLKTREENSFRLNLTTVPAQIKPAISIFILHFIANKTKELSHFYFQQLSFYQHSTSPK
jgi:hypothetical protein